MSPWIQLCPSILFTESKKKSAFIIGQNHRNQPEQNEYHLHSIDHNERLNEQQVCVYITIKTPQGDRCTISCQGASGHS